MYNDLNRSPKRQFDVPFLTSYMGFTSRQIETRFRKEDPIDQYLRYHVNRKRRKWKTSHGFQPDQHIIELMALRNRLVEIIGEMDGQQESSA
jgi:hypothetical protein